MTAFMPEPHSLLMVVRPVASGRPALREAWRAGPLLETGWKGRTHNNFVDILALDACGKQLL